MAQTATKTEAKSPVDAAIAARAAAKFRPIDPASVILHEGGMSFSHWFVRLPEGFLADDLKEFSLWSRVQATRGKAMRKLDRVTFVSYAEDWIADAVVAAANEREASFAGIRIVQLPTQNQALFSDGTYRVSWAGSGFQVFRSADNYPMPSSLVANEALAVNEIKRLYPTRAA